jgi:hypothetical protein
MDIMGDIAVFRAEPVSSTVDGTTIGPGGNGYTKGVAPSCCPRRHHATFQIMMVGAAMLVAAPQRWLWSVSLLVLLGGAYVAGMSVGMFYLPTLVAAGWVAARRQNERRSTPGFLDTKPQDGVIYTESELDAINDR